MADEDDSLSSDFENGMLAGFVDGVSSIQQLLIKAAEDRASTAPATSAYLKALTVGIWTPSDATRKRQAPGG